MIDKINTKITDLLKRFSNLESSFSQRDDWLNRISHYATPTLYNYKNDKSSSRSNLPNDVYDSTMVQSANIFANGLYSYLTNPSSKWFKLILRDKKQMEISGVKDWLESVENKMFSVLSATNFYSEMHQQYSSLVGGNCVLYREKDVEDVVRYYALPLTDCYFELDSRGKVGAMYRRIKRTPLQVVDEFPETVSEKVRQMAQTAQADTYIDVIHGVRPRWHRDMRKKDKLNKKFESVYIDKDNKTLLKEDGYDTFPFFVGWFIKDPSSPCGYGPGHLCMYDIKTLNQMMVTTIRAAQKQADPPFSIPHDGYIMPFLTDPGAVNYRLTEDANDTAKPLVTGSNFLVGMEMIRDGREMIKSAFFVDMFLQITNVSKRMTTVEVQELIAERAPMLGPVIDLLTTDYLNNIIEDLFSIVAEDKLIDPPPQALQNADYTIEYVSPLAKAQKVSELRGIQSFMQMLAGTVQFNPDVIDNVDFDKMTQIVGDVSGIPQTVIKEPAQVLEDRQMRREAEAKRLMREQAEQMSIAAKNASAADLNTAKAARV